MIGIMLVAHGGIAESLMSCATHMLGQQPEQCVALPIDSHHDFNKMIPRIKTCIDALNQGHGVIILTDIMGGTPCNTMQQFLVPDQVEIITGMNLPMLIRTLNYRDQTLQFVVKKAISGGIDGVVRLSNEE